MGDYNIEDIYQGGYSSFKPSYGDVFTGYRASAKDLGMTTDPRTMNVVKEVSSKLSSGQGKIEMALVNPEIFDSVPKQYLKEVNQLAKLTGIDVSVHAPVVDSAGIGRQGFSEMERKSEETKMVEVLKRSHIVDPDGNVPVVVHASEGIPGTEWKEIPWKEKGIKGKANRIIAIDQETGQMRPIEEDIRYYPDMKEVKPEIREKLERGEISREEFARNRKKYVEEIPLEQGKRLSPERLLDISNESKWDNELSQLLFNNERADAILQKNGAQIQHLLKTLSNKSEKEQEEILNQFPEQRHIYNQYRNAQEYIKDTEMNIHSLFSKAYKFGNKEQKERLSEIKNNYQKVVEKASGSIRGPSEALQFLIHELKSQDVAPKTLVPIQDFAVEQSSKTFGNSAFQAYKEFGDKAPMLAIENPPVGHGLSTGEDLKNLVIASRKKFVENAVDEGMNKKEAEKIAEKLIAATWDVGHINMLRKQGMGKKEIIEETKKVAPFVKHVHFSDNFGFEHTELPMGMGNVPLKEMMEKLGEEGFEGRKIIEAGQWWQHMQTNPLKESLEGLGSPMYSSGRGPYWNQAVGLQQGYFSGYGNMLPQTHYETFGAGFSNLPMELGGQRGGGGSRMSGTPME